MPASPHLPQTPSSAPLAAVVRTATSPGSLTSNSTYSGRVPRYVLTWTLATDPGPGAAMSGPALDAAGARTTGDRAAWEGASSPDAAPSSGVTRAAAPCGDGVPAASV